MLDSTPARTPRIRPLVLTGLVLAAALARLVPHPPNFTPVGALALFAGACFGSRLAAFAVPLAAMLMSDALLFALHGWPLDVMTAVVYGCFALTVWVGTRMRRGSAARPIVVGSFLAALVFFVATNLAVWGAGDTYSLDAAGLAMCYVAALPYLGNMLAADLAYCLVLFGGLELVQRRFPALARA